MMISTSVLMIRLKGHILTFEGNNCFKKERRNTLDH